MRTFMGILLGIVVTIGTVYVFDAWTTAPPEPVADQRPIVNWDVVAKKWDGVATKARVVWSKLSGGSPNQ